MTDGASCIRNEVARDRTLREAREIASDMGLTFVRTLTPSGLAAMAGNTLDRDWGRSVRRAGLVIEATDGSDTHYIAMEVSFTGKPAHPAIASVRNDREATEAESGDVYWHPLEAARRRPSDTDLEWSARNNKS